MTIEEIKKRVAAPEYGFLRENKNLGDNIVLLGLGGSHAYGTNNENSDLDIRGIATNSKANILTSNDFGQVVDVETDTTIYSFDKIVDLLCRCNPNTIEILGLKPEHYLYLSPIGEEIVEKRKMFLSKQAVHSFGGYANAQLRRLENKSARLVSQSDMEKHILKTIEHASIDFKRNYFPINEGELELYIDTAIQEGYDTEIFMDICLKHYPLRDWANMWNEMKAIVSGYNKIGKRNSKAIEHSKLGKHMCHLIRLYLMCFDILENGEICTYREKEHDFLMDIRNGKYLDKNKQPTEEFYKIVGVFESRLDYLKDHTNLPDVVDKEKINAFIEYVNLGVVLNG